MTVTCSGYGGVVTNTAHITASFPMGAQEATVTASGVFETYYGAHVEVLGGVVADTGLIPTDRDVCTFDHLIPVAMRAIRDAFRRCELPFDTDAEAAAMRALYRASGVV